MMRGEDVISATVSLLRQNPCALVCGNAACGTCVPARHMVDAEAARWRRAHPG